MGKKGKKVYDLFDEGQPTTHVRLPQMEPRQPGESVLSKADKSVSALATTNSRATDSESLNGRPSLISTPSSAKPTESQLLESIKVKIPKFTHDIQSKEELTTPGPCASSLPHPHRKHSKAISLTTASPQRRPGRVSAAVRPSGTQVTRPNRRRTSVVPKHTSARLGSSSTVSGSSKNTTGTAHVSSAVATSAVRHPVSQQSPLRAGKARVPPRSDAKPAGMKAARARYQEQKAANEKAAAAKARPVVTSPPTARSNAAATSSAASKGKAKSPTSSPQQWIDYAADTSPPADLPRPAHRGASKNLGADTMFRHASSPGHRSRGTVQRQHGGPIARPYNDWTAWVEVQVNVYGLTPEIGTGHLWSSFIKEGNIVVIDIIENSAGARTGKARIKFSPPPATAFWHAERYPVDSATGVCYARVELDSQPRTFKAPSPINPLKKYSEVMKLDAESIDFGIMYDPTTMMSMFKAVPLPYKSIVFRQSMLHREIVVELELAILDPRPDASHPNAGRRNRTELIRFSIPFRQLEVIHQIKAEENKVVLLMSLDQPPRYFRKVDELETHEDNGRFWTQNDAWYRQTDIIYNPKSLRGSPLTLRKFKPIIDIGRWTTYRFSFDMARNNRSVFHEMCQALKDYNIRFAPFPDFRLIGNREPGVWDLIDEPVVVQTKSRSLLEELIEDRVPPLAFPVRYQLEVCISQGLLNEHNLTQEFVTRLMGMDQTKARDVLEHIANQKKRLYDPTKILSMTVVKGSASRRNIPQYCMHIRSATVTPSTVYYNTPTVETSNRVVRQYAEHADRFLRVRFTDEKFQGRINWTDKDTMNEVFTRIKRTMNNGVKIGDRTYEFLAFGNSQFREHGAYFFAPLSHLNVNHIRQWMGLFDEIRIIAKHAARLGQCFSTTRAINCPKVSVVEIDDIVRNHKGKKYTFTDGVGKISPFLAQLAASELGLTTPEPPSVFQFRLGGCKGVLAVWPDVGSREIHIRETQYKFPAKHDGLEIIRWSQLASANLNRQLILVLSSLGVSDAIFLNKLKMQLASLEQAMTDKAAALALLQKDIDQNQMTLTLAGMILDGFQETMEPFLVSLLHLWRAWSIKALKEKARITIGDGALLLGCIDETATLKGHFDGVVIDDLMPLQEKEAMLPQVFVQLSKGPNNRPCVVKGPMLLARNPSLHPGDIRVVRGVDVPGLRHLKDVVVLPQTGDRDISSMCSGGDLDGDDYIVMWDRDLLPTQWNHDPMDYTPPAPLIVDREVTTDDITSFFVTYMKNDTLPAIAHAHVAQADYSDEGIKDERCLKLAALHSQAVDYVKSGIPARMTRDLRPRKWPHFMEKIHKPKEQIYESKKILGQLYDQVERVNFDPVFDKPFDERILNAYRLDSAILQKAADLKYQYDAAIRRIMAQHEIKTEFEVWSTFVLQHSNVVKDFKLHEEIGRLSQTLKDEFRSECYRNAGSKDFHVLAPFVAAMYHVTNEEMQLALRECRQMVTVAGVDRPLRKMDPSSMPLMSFPWLFHGILGRIANGDFSATNETLIMAVQGEPKRSVQKQKAFETDEELLLETAEGVTHRGQNLVLFGDVDGNETVSVEKQATPKSGSGSSSSFLERNITPAGPGELDLFPDNEHKKVEEDSSPPPTEGSSTPVSSSEKLGIKKSDTVSHNAAHLDELLQRDEQDVGTVSRLLTPSHSGSPSSEQVDASHKRPIPLVGPLFDIVENKNSANGELEETDDEDGSEEELVEIHMD